MSAPSFPPDAFARFVTNGAAIFREHSARHSLVMTWSRHAQCGLYESTTHETLKWMLNQAASLDRIFHALADPSRRVIVERLSRGPASVSELAEPLEMSLPAVLQHLQLLESSGLVQSEKAGRVRTCRINEKALRTAEQWIAKRRASWERHFDRLGAFLADTDSEGKGKK
jgi:DNA-binding transcriptional ArsR family regulator